MNVICNKKQFCDEAPSCGGAQPHAFDDQECNKCPIDKTARCVPVSPEKESKVEHEQAKCLVCREKGIHQPWCSAGQGFVNTPVG